MNDECAKKIPMYCTVIIDNGHIKTSSFGRVSNMAAKIMDMVVPPLQIVQDTKPSDVALWNSGERLVVCRYPTNSKVLR
jgi:hypothetical protein